MILNVTRDFGPTRLERFRLRVRQNMMSNKSLRTHTTKQRRSVHSLLLSRRAFVVLLATHRVQNIVLPLGIPSKFEIIRNYCFVPARERRR